MQLRQELHDLANILTSVDGMFAIGRYNQARKEMRRCHQVMRNVNRAIEALEDELPAP